MSMPSTTTWIFDLARGYADFEGTALFHSKENSYLALNPDEKVETHSWTELEELLGEFDGELPIPKWVGYLPYEMGEVPAIFYRPTTVIHVDHQKGTTHVYGPDVPMRERRARTSALTLGYRSDTLKSYCEKIARAHEWILDGEIYQVNLSQEFHLEGRSDPFAQFEAVYALNPAPFSVFMQCGTHAIVSSSPERFVCRRGDRLETRPIKGTAPRGKTAEEDRANKAHLLSSEKERAELLMITDLMRNDLSRVCEPGSVLVNELYRCEAYTNVFHLLSIIEGKGSGSPISLLRELFPAGSITGCPKIRAMEAIRALEGRPRGVYTGSIGYLAHNGDFDFNVAIRTLVVHPTHVQIQLGGGIVSDSDPIKEYEETLHKGESLFTILGAHELCLS